MRESIFILVVLFAVVAWTIFRYRKQILGVIGFGKMLRDAAAGKLPNKVGQAPKSASVQLAKCAVCGVNVPLETLKRIGDGSLICDRH